MTLSLCACGDPWHAWVHHLLSFDSEGQQTSIVAARRVGFERTSQAVTIPGDGSQS